MKNSLGKNAVYKVILNIFNLLVPLFVGPYIAGLLSPELYGVYNRVFAEFQVFFIMGGFGIYNYGIREISKVQKSEEKFQNLFTSLFVIGILSNIIVTIFYVLYFVSRSDGIDAYIYLVMIIQMASNVFYIEFVNEAVENYGFIAKKTIVVRGIYLVAIFLFVRKPTDVIIYSVVVSLTVFINNFVSFLYLKKQYRFNFKHLSIKPHIFPLIVNLLFVNVELLYGQLDKVMLSPFVNDIAVTEYTLPTTLVGMIATIPLSLVTVAIPRLSRYIGENNMNSYKRTLSDTIRVYMAMIIPMSFGVLVLSKEVMWLYSKDVYTYVFPVLALAAMSRIIFGYQSLVTHLVMYVNGMEKKLTVFLFGCGILNLTLNMIFVVMHKFSAFTALLTTMLSVVVFIVIAKKYSEKTLGFKVPFFTKQILKYMLVACTFIPVSLVVNSFNFGYLVNIVIEVIVCMAIYGGYMLWTKDPLVEIVLSKVKRK